MVVAASSPRLSWVLVPFEPSPVPRGVRQVACQVIVSSNPQALGRGEADVWDSGRVETSNSLGFVYQGRALRDSEGCWWKVRVWTVTDEESQPQVGPWSAPGFWRNGLLDFPGDWIGFPKAETDASAGDPDPARLLRRDFLVSKPFNRAFLAFSMAGSGKVFINGQQVGDAVMGPAVSDPLKRVHYLQYEVASMLTVGENVVAVELAESRESARLASGESPNEPRTWLRLRIEFPDGTVETISSNKAWKAIHDGPRRIVSETKGEFYHLDKVRAGWNSFGYEDSSWSQVRLMDPPPGELQAQALAPMRVMKTIAPVSVQDLGGGLWLLDFGRYIFGRPRLDIPANLSAPLHVIPVPRRPRLPIPADLPDGLSEGRFTILPAQSGNPATRGIAPEHSLFGFRFLLVGNSVEQGIARSVRAELVHDDIERISYFGSSEPRLDELHILLETTLRATYRNVPIVSPEGTGRDGWLSRPRSLLHGESLFFDVASLHAKWLKDMAESIDEESGLPDKAPEFIQSRSGESSRLSAAFALPRVLVERHGNPVPAEAFAPVLMNWLERHTPGAGELPSGNWSADANLPLIDPAAPASDRAPIPAAPGKLIATAHLRLALDETARLARVTGDEAAAALLTAKAAELAAAAHVHFWNPTEKSFGGNSQTALILALAADLVDASVRGELAVRLAEDIADRGIATGSEGMAFLLGTLNSIGRPDLALACATSNKYPSWGYMLGSEATTIREEWHGDLGYGPEASTRLVGDAAAWLFESLAGIAPHPETIGFSKIVIQPTLPAGLEFVRAGFLSPHGWIRSHWTQAGGRPLFEIEVPLNTTAEIHIPFANAAEVTESGAPIEQAKGLRLVAKSDREIVLRAGSGNYRFEVSPSVLSDK